MNLPNSSLCDNEHTVHQNPDISDFQEIRVTCGDTELAHRWFQDADPEHVQTWLQMVLMGHTNQLQAEKIQQMAGALGEIAAEFAAGFQEGVDSIRKRPAPVDPDRYRYLRRRVTPSSVQGYGLSREDERALLDALTECREVAEDVLDRMVAEYVNAGHEEPES